MPRKTCGETSSASRNGSFNEAAARCRGKRGTLTSSTRSSTSGFNEAAARCRGKPDHRVDVRPTRGSFNEAAARCRGKHGARARHGERRAASMRPRPDAAENAAQTAAAIGGPALQ